MECRPRACAEYEELWLEWSFLAPTHVQYRMYRMSCGLCTLPIYEWLRLRDAPRNEMMWPLDLLGNLQPLNSGILIPGLYSECYYLSTPHRHKSTRFGASCLRSPPSPYCFLLAIDGGSPREVATPSRILAVSLNPNCRISSNSHL